MSLIIYKHHYILIFSLIYSLSFNLQNNSKHLFLSSTTTNDFITAFMFPVLYGGIQLFGGISAVTIYLLVKRRGNVCCITKEMVVPPDILEETEGENRVTDTKVYSIETDPANIAAGFEFNGGGFHDNGVENPAFRMEGDSHPNLVGSPKLEKKVEVKDTIKISDNNYKESDS